MKTGLEAAAKANGRSLSAEAASRLQQSLVAEGDPLDATPFLRWIGRRLLARYALDHERLGGAGGVAAELLSLEDPHTYERPAPAEIARRRKAMAEMAVAYVDPDPKRRAEFFKWLTEYARAVEARHATTDPKPS